MLAAAAARRSKAAWLRRGGGRLLLLLQLLPPLVSTATGAGAAAAGAMDAMLEWGEQSISPAASRASCALRLCRGGVWGVQSAWIQRALFQPNRSIDAAAGQIRGCRLGSVFFMKFIARCRWLRDSSLSLPLSLVGRLCVVVVVGHRYF
jgi:hypothetical protein